MPPMKETTSPVASDSDREPTFVAGFDPMRITRPVPALMAYYALVSLMTVVAFPLVILPLYFKYETLRYRFDNDGLSVSWGILFRREVYLTYRRIQDIHLTRNLLQRWMGLATVSIQTASGSATPEMSIEGIFEAEALRDFLYGKMRGANVERSDDEAGPIISDEVLTLLKDIRDGIQTLVNSSSTDTPKVAS